MPMLEIDKDGFKNYGRYRDIFIFRSVCSYSDVGLQLQTDGCTGEQWFSVQYYALKIEIIIGRQLCIENAMTIAYD